MQRLLKDNKIFEEKKKKNRDCDGGVPKETAGEVGLESHVGCVRMSHREGSWEDPGAGGGEREGHSLERVHAEGHVHPRAVGQEGGERRLLK